ncbi:MAG: D-tyrosyl-tRNA(Tyr) deacylase [Candidatus Didemnitutus sp.]|nr:D-tyrosyl-tRNA(Tyr) deacylase [Candidatus Didemnitutus sp.]
MRVVLQRVSSARVTVDGRVTGEIGRGLLLLQGIEPADTAADGEWLAQKIAKLRIFADAEGQMNRSVADIGGGILVVSQFTLHASTAKGTRPSFHAAARPEHARPLYEQFIGQLRTALAGSPPSDATDRIQTGEFGAMMQVSLVNDGPVTLILDSKTRD